MPTWFPTMQPSFFAYGEAEDDLGQAARLGLLKAARTHRPDRGSGFRNFAELCVRAELITFVKAATCGKRAVLNESLRWEQIVDDDMELGQVTADRKPSPHEQLVIRGELERVVSVVASCSPCCQTVVARVLNGASLADAGRGLGTSARPEKTADNALQRVRRKLAAAA